MAVTLLGVVGREAWPCEPINARFMVRGEVVSVNNEMMRGPSSSLAYMLDALFPRRQGDPVTVSIRIEINPVSQDMQVTNELNTALPGRSVTRKVRCEGVEWVYTYAGSGSAEGVYRTRGVKVSFKQVPLGDLIVRRDKHLVSGLIFKNKEFYSSVSSFKALDGNPDNLGR